MKNKTVETKLNIEVVGIDTIKPHPKNYRKHGQDQIDHLIRSIEENGVYRPIVVAGDTILAGHGVHTALKALGQLYVPICRVPLKPDEPRALRLLAGDNEMQRLGEVDDRALSEILKEVHLSIGLEGTGFDEMQLANLLYVTRNANEIADMNSAREWVGMPAFDVPEKDSVICLKIQFRTHADRDQFIKQHDVTVSHYTTENAWSTWWPEKERDDWKSLRFETDEAAAPAPAKNKGKAK